MSFTKGKRQTRNKSLELYLKPPFGKDLAWAIGQVKKARGVDSAAGAMEAVGGRRGGGGGWN